MNEISRSTFEQYHRARCPICKVTCEQRRCSVLLVPPGSLVSDCDTRLAHQCLECEVVYVVDELVQSDDCAAEPKPTAEPEPTDAERHRSLEREYGCVNCHNSNPRHCAESGHLDCDALKAEPTLRAGWRAIKRAFGGVYYFNGSLPDGCAVFDYAKVGMAPMWSCTRDGEFYSTLEAAMQRAEELAGEL